MGSTNKTCPRCKRYILIRVAREGFLQKNIYARLGRYPWECPQCRKTFMLHDRGVRYRKRVSRSEEEGALTKPVPSGQS